MTCLIIEFHPISFSNFRGAVQLLDRPFFYPIIKLPESYFLATYCLFSNSIT